MKVKDVMIGQSLKSCSPETKLQDAARTMQISNCGALPVVDKNNKVLGIVTDRDICLAIAQNQSKRIEEREVGDIMSKNIQTVHDTDEVSQAYSSMRKNQIGRLPVVDEAGKLKGIVSLHRLINKSVHEGEEKLGDTNAPGENLLKTIQAVTDRYSNNKEPNSPSPAI